MESCGEQQLTPIQTHQLSPGLASKPSISVADDGSGQFPLSHNPVEESYSYRPYICGCQENKPTTLAKSIYYSHNKLGIHFCKIDVQHLHWLLRHCNIQLKALWCPGVCFYPLTGITLSNVL